MRLSERACPCLDRALQQLRLLGFERLDALTGVGDVLQLLAGILAELQHRRNVAAIFAGQVVDQVEAFFDLLQPLGVVLDGLQVIAQAAHQLGERVFEHGGLIGQLCLRGVDLGQPGQGARGLPDQVAGGGRFLRAFIQHLQRLLGIAGQRLGIGEAVALAAQFGLFTGLEPGVLDLLGLEGEHLHAPVGIGLGLADLAQLGAHARQASGRCC